MKVSIICTNFNKGKWISEAIESFLNQITDFPYEIILVDDASTDESVNIIKEYTERYPEQIRAIFNRENKGISETWKSICLEARGQYIARCDGDDFWTDSYKLQKQVNLLEANPDSSWSNTDFDMVNLNGEVIEEAVFKNGILPLIDNFEDMVVFKGMTMASTWLVERQLMQEVSMLLDADDTDDTYVLQLELFKRTKLVTLQESTTVYRMNVGSDSKPLSKEKAQKRFEGILKTQLTFIEKYPDSDKDYMIKALLVKDKESDLSIFERDGKLSNQLLLIEQLRTISNNQNDFIESLKKDVRELQANLFHTQEKLLRTSEQFEQLKKDHDAVIHSRRWTIPTKIINFFRRKK